MAASHLSAACGRRSEEWDGAAVKIHSESESEFWAPQEFRGLIIKADDIPQKIV